MADHPNSASLLGQRITSIDKPPYQGPDFRGIQIRSLLDKFRLLREIEILYGVTEPGDLSRLWCASIVNREFSVAVRKSEAIALGQPVMPVADGFLC